MASRIHRHGGAARFGVFAEVTTQPMFRDSDEPKLRIREFDPADWPQVWSILEPIFRAGETYAVPRDITSSEARQLWTQPSKKVFVALDARTECVLGTYYLRPNQDGPGGHVCNCGYAVASHARGRGIASTMCVHSQTEAVARGFLAMQFNLVAASNTGAVRLWTSLGFTTIGTLPMAFRHAEAGLVDAYVMFKTLGTTEKDRPGYGGAPSESLSIQS